MTRLVSPDRACRGVNAGALRYDTDPMTGGIEVPNRIHELGLVAQGFFRSSPPVMAAGWTCECGFVALINHCPRCGSSDLRRGHD